MKILLPRGKISLYLHIYKALLPDKQKTGDAATEQCINLKDVMMVT